MKKAIICLIIVIISSVSLLSVSADTARKLDFTPSLDTSTEAEVSYTALSDGNYTTYIVIEPGEKLIIDTEDAEWVYVKFRLQSPKSYSIICEDGQVISKGESGFLHELSRICKSNTIALCSDERMSITELELYSEGELPKSVQRWEPTFEVCDILITSTHPDDDTLFFGALAAEQAALGRTVQTVFICNCEKMPDRANELLDGQWTLGITAYPIFGVFEDYYSMSLEKAKSQFDIAKLAEFIVSAIRRTRPQVVITHDINGEYGHGAHMLVSELTLKAIGDSADKSYHPLSEQMYGTHQVLKTYVHLYEQYPIILDVNRAMAELGGATPFSVAENAYDCHKSQHVWDLKVTTCGTSDCRRFGLFNSAVECDIKSNDILNGIVPISPTVSETAEGSPELACLLTSDSDNDTSVKHEVSLTQVSESSVVACFTILLASVLIAAVYFIVMFIKEKTRN